MFVLLLFLFNTEGVQLLCLIDKGLDACRYLQTYGEWDQAAWLAKVKHRGRGYGREVKAVGRYLVSCF